MRLCAERRVQKIVTATAIARNGMFAMASVLPERQSQPRTQRSRREAKSRVDGQGIDVTPLLLTRRPRVRY